MCKIDDIKLPVNVGVIPCRCFDGCRQLKSVKFALGTKLEQIKAQAFARSGLEEIRIPEFVKQMDEKCFFGCPDLKKIEFGSQLPRLDPCTFSGSHVTEMSVPEMFMNFVSGFTGLQDTRICSFDKH